MASASGNEAPIQWLMALPGRRVDLGHADRPGASRSIERRFKWLTSASPWRRTKQAKMIERHVAGPRVRELPRPKMSMEFGERLSERLAELF